MMKNFQNTYFTKKERNGILLLVVIVFLVFLYSFIHGDFNGPSKYKFEKFESRKVDTTEQQKPEPSLKKIYDKPKVFERHEFDPNTVTKEDLMNMGVSKFAANNLEKYRQKAKIKSAEQFAKIYGMEDVAEELSRYIKIKEEISDTDSKKQKEITSTDTMGSLKGHFIPKDSTQNRLSIKKDLLDANYSFEINTVDSFQLQLLKGIGPFYSSVIIKYRDRLGGYFSLDQLSDIDLLPLETIAAIRPFLTVDNSKIKRINVNKATIDEMSSHPYFLKKKAYIFERYRKNHPDLREMEDFAKVKIFTEKELDLLSYYLTF